MRQARELPSAELAPDVHEADQAVLQMRPLTRCGCAGKRLEPPIHLDRVAGDGNGVLSASAQKLGDGNRNRRLPDPGRAEYRQDL